MNEFNKIIYSKQTKYGLVKNYRVNMVRNYWIRI